MPELIHYAANNDGPHALYADTALEAFGSMEQIAERVMEIAQVRFVRSADFLLGGHRYVDAAKSTEEIDEYRKIREAEEARTTSEQTRQHALNHAAALRTQAADLIRQADKIAEENAR